MKKFYYLLLVVGILIVAAVCSNKRDVTGPANQQDKQAINGTLWGEGTLGDFVWGDANCNGIQDLRELGIAGVTVKLYTCHDSLLRVTQTDSTGHYMFTDVLPGQYAIRFILPTGYTFSPMDQGTNDSIDSDANVTTGFTQCITLDSSEVDLTWDAGLCRQQQEEGCLGDFVWEDLNCNGIQNEGEPGVESVMVKLYNCRDSSLVRTTLTNLRGRYLFAELPAGNYFLRFVLPDGFKFSPKDQGRDDRIDSDADTLTGRTVCIELAEGECDSTWDAGLCRLEQEEGCTFTIGYWKNHAGFGPQADVVTPLLPIWLGLPDSSASLHVTTAQIAYNVLRMRTYGVPSNGITKLYAQLLAAKLNIANGASDMDIAETIEQADIFLSAHSWQTWSNLSQRQRQMVLSLMGRIDSYNEGFIGPGHCGEDDEDMD